MEKAARHGKKQEKSKAVSDNYEYSYPDVKTLLSWSAPGRPFKKKGREFYVAVILITILIEIILFLFSQYELMLAVFSLTFLSLVLASIPPRDFHYRISNQGITIEDHFYLWEELYDFYFKKIDGADVLFVRTQTFIPGELKIPLGSLDLNHIKKILLHFLPYREVVGATFIEKSADWLSRVLPLEKT